MSTIARVEGRTDTELVGAALADDQAAWNELVRRYTRLVWHVIHGFRQLDQDRRADIHQTTWLRLAERLDSLRDPERVGPWLATTARRECLRQLGRQQREIPTDDDYDDLRADDAPAAAGLLRSESDAALWAAFDRLRPECQQLLRLLIADPPFTYDEIAEILDIPRGSIGPTRQRCLDTLRRSPGIAALEDRS